MNDENVHPVEGGISTQVAPVVQPVQQFVPQPAPAVATQLPKKDYMHLDDFLNSVADPKNPDGGRLELAASFATRAKKRGWVKREPAEWRQDFEAFAKEVPR